MSCPGRQNNPIDVNFHLQKSLEIFDKKSADKIWSKKDKGIKVSHSVPNRVKQTHWADKIYFNPFWIALHEHDLTRLTLSTVRLKGGADLGSSFTPDRISQRSTKMHFDQTTSYFGGILKALIFIIFLSFIQGNAVFCYVNVVYEQPAAKAFSVIPIFIFLNHLKW